ncbi:hypothetical protein YC2023_119836 [Brassica napus]
MGCEPTVDTLTLTIRFFFKSKSRYKLDNRYTHTSLPLLVISTELFRSLPFIHRVLPPTRGRRDRRRSHNLTGTGQTMKTSGAAEQAREDSQSQDMRRNRADDNSEVFRFTASRAGEDHSKRYPGKIPFDRRTDARRYINDNRRSRTYQEASYRSYNNPKPMEWREKGHHRPPQQHREQDTRPGNNSARHSSHRAGPRSPGPALPREHYYPILDKPGGNQREESSSSRDMMIDGVRGNPLPTSPVLDNQKNVSEALDVIRGTMTHYTQVADPTESAIRRERVRLTEERGQIEEAARKMAKNLRTKSPTLQQSPPENERVPAIQRLGPVEPALVDNTQPAETVWTKRKPGRPPGRRVTPSSPKPTRSASSKKRSAQQAKQPPNKRKLTTEAHRLKKTPTKKAIYHRQDCSSFKTTRSVPGLRPGYFDAEICCLGVAQYEFYNCRPEITYLFSRRPIVASILSSGWQGFIFCIMTICPTTSAH